MTARRLLISGRVQGVGYRHWLTGQASALGVCGWVRNLGDGRVEAVVSGSDAAVAALIQACWRGPALAAVTEVEISAAEPVRTPGFQAAPTAR